MKFEMTLEISIDAISNVSFISFLVLWKPILYGGDNLNSKIKLRYY